MYSRVAWAKVTAAGTSWVVYNFGILSYASIFGKDKDVFVFGTDQCLFVIQMYKTYASWNIIPMKLLLMQHVHWKSLLIINNYVHTQSQAIDLSFHWGITLLKHFRPFYLVCYTYPIFYSDTSAYS